ncbi:hypothetical protein LA303_01535 [Candidatus Sulfidibacterium hydrothermale]|uniref:hypothetical protein n=1 Tax=Candidatus Sulfidibacterium hydrothermale TaxID=2875962 RepID=UPI001F0A1927|nr:hypothetical protein [Candidatus Sulfidibacterium hydrothermale]UBM62674.1 hypothetical protein LA303_01535 [Candidatus Sulfidibacterium hydrothermale]
MKRKLSTFFVLIFALISGTGVMAQNLIKLAPQVIVVNLGPKNPHFDEAIYPHLKFYYLPDIQVANGADINHKFDITGSPEFIVRAYNERHLKQYDFLLFDKNGICYTEGSDLLESVDISKALCSNGKEFGDNLKDVVKKGKTAKVKSGDYPWGHVHPKLKVGLRHSAVVRSPFLTGHPFPQDVTAETADGKKVVLENVIKGKPTVVVFMYIPPTGNLETLNKFYKGNAPKPPEAIAKKQVKNTLYLFMLEGQFFGYNPKKGLKAKYGK